MKGWSLVIDVAKCENCNNCFLACKDEHVGNDWPGYAAPQPNLGHNWIEVHAVERGCYPLIDVGYLPLPCMHCQDAPCVRAAEGGAVYRRPDGVVLVDPVKSRGQKHLLEACPYGVIRWNEELEIPQKCTLCAHLLDDGWTKTRCVQSCPTGALTLRHLDDDEAGRGLEGEGLEVHHPEFQTRPRVRYRNLYRFTRCFLGGTVAVTIDRREECAEGAKVELRTAADELLAECRADGFGDFKFDDLGEDSGTYVVRAALSGHGAKSVEVHLGKSTNLGKILLDGEA